jgi:vitamin K-dependent gamma-carboxylase
MMFRQIHPASFTMVRILVGALCLEEIWHQQGLSNDAYIERRRIEPRFAFHYKGFAWIPRVDDLDTWKIILWLGFLAGVGIMVGGCYRLSTITFAVIFSYIYLSEASYYLNHLYLFVCMTWIFTLTEGNTYFAIVRLFS